MKLTQHLHRAKRRHVQAVFFEGDTSKSNKSSKQKILKYKLNFISEYKLLTLHCFVHCIIDISTFAISNWHHFSALKHICKICKKNGCITKFSKNKI